ncbi:hypothetical protein Ssi03_77350 [Sphaerisporangium siamense]|uniref:Uncharacterized protein n=1 Tax=Sphaerisporangium siamense TaxID=795645 RepID=A0A7W7DG48_9ACTN|nr:DUF6225 family protein [Sphaerisporangium siamense]MBB4706157.1 hypothetical protein [Sphaerisporangium siamense]GII89745.1 hypothetical protein Ssi03_77350 [Sphaerisporangium siamense]
MSDTDQTREQVRLVPWETVTDAGGRRAWTAGQLRAAIAHLADDAPIVVYVATDDDGEDSQIIVDGCHAEIAGTDQPDPLYGITCAWPANPNLHIWPDAWSSDEDRRPPA